MENYIYLSDNRIIELVDNVKINYYIDIEQLNKKTLLYLKHFIKSQKKLVIYVNMNQIDNAMLIMKKIVYLYNYCLKNNIEIGNHEGKYTIIAYISIQPQDISKKLFEQFKEFFFVLTLNDKKDIYEYIYDRTCDELDKIFTEKNYCDFQNDSCVKQRNCKSYYYKDGCCHSFYYNKIDGFPVSTGKCKYNCNGKCLTKCLPCKMFTCKYLRKKKIKFEYSDFPLLEVFLNKKQKKQTMKCFFKTKEEIMDSWLNMM